MKTQRNLIFLPVIPIILSACAGSNLSNQTDLAGTAWNLTAINQDHPLEGTETTLAFKDTQISGKACNLYSGSYQVNGDEISFGPLTQTEMACMEPEGIMAQEQIYLELLRDAQRFELVDDVLTIFIDQQQTLTFEKQQENATQPTPTEEQVSIISPIPTAETQAPISTPVFEPPLGFREYQDMVVGISIYIPES